MIQWKDEFSVGINEIDQQHKKLFQLVGDLLHIANLKDGYDHHDEIVRIFNKLSDYTVYHFKYEEELMDKYGYDAKEASRHKLEHGGFVMKMLKIQKEDLDKNQNKILLDVIGFAVDWIAKHILDTDKKYAGFFISKGIND